MRSMYNYNRASSIYYDLMCSLGQEKQDKQEGALEDKGSRGRRAAQWGKRSSNFVFKLLFTHTHTVAAAKPQHLCISFVAVLIIIIIKHIHMHINIYNVHMCVCA